MKFQKTDETARGGFPIYAVIHDHQTIGTVYKVETTKTGFRRGRCVGQVPCTLWRAKTADGRELPERRGFHGFRSRKDAAQALLDD